MKASICDVEFLSGQLACLVDAISRTRGPAPYRLLEDQSITVGQMKALLVLSGNAKPASSGDLARELSLSLTAVQRRRLAELLAELPLEAVAA